MLTEDYCRGSLVGMIEILKGIFDPTYWLTVIPIGIVFTVFMWRRDSKQIAKQRKDKS